MISRVLVAGFVLAVCAVSAVVAHTPIVNGTTTGSQFATWQTALNIPTNLKSLSARRISTCQHPYFWLKFTGKRGSPLDLSATTTAAAGFANVRLTMVVFGRGLPKRSRNFAFPTPPTGGASVLPGPDNISNCNFIKDKEARDGYRVVNRRCGRISATTGVGHFPILSNKWFLPATGTYYFVFFTKSQYTAWYSIATGSHGHIHAEVPLPKAPMGNGPKGLNWNNKNARYLPCAAKGQSPPRKIYA